MVNINELHFFVQVAMWYFFSIMFNIEVKRIFIDYKIPWTVSMTSFAVASLGCAAIMGRGERAAEASDAHTRLSTTPYQKLIVIGLLQFLGNFATNLSIEAMSVSFTHVVKATEVIFVLLWTYGLVHYGFISRAVTTSKSQLIVIGIITLGVIVASLKEASFSWQGLIFGMLANIGFSGRNTLAKWVMTNHNISKERLFVIASMVSCAPCILPMLVFELPRLYGVPRSLYLDLFYTSVMYFLYNTVSFTVLEGVTPVTHAIANCCKRLFIVVASLLVFRTVIQPLNVIGSLIAIFGVALYSQLGTGANLLQVVKKNLLFIVFGTLIVAGVLLGPVDLNARSVTDASISLSNECSYPSPVECPICPDIPAQLQTPLVIPADPAHALVVAQPRTHGNSEMIKNLQAEILRQMKPYFAKYKKAVILDVPDHNNKGDSAIYTGEEAFLRLVNIEIIYACSDEGVFKCDTKKIIDIAEPANTVICLHGGGNFGDLWTWVVNARNKFLRELAGQGYDFIMFPQTITFRDKKNIKGTVDFWTKIENLKLFAVREMPSKEIMDEHFPSINTLFMPDMAWFMGHKEIITDPKFDILFFLRTDHEGDQKLAEQVRKFISSTYPDLTYKIDDWTNFDVPRVNSLAEMNYDRFYSGLKFLTQAKVVVTNRYHGHILSTLLDLPHVIVDNIYGKVFNGHKAWTMNATGVETATAMDEAVNKAVVLIKEFYN